MDLEVQENSKNNWTDDWEYIQEIFPSYRDQYATFKEETGLHIFYYGGKPLWKTVSEWALTYFDTGGLHDRRIEMLFDVAQGGDFLSRTFALNALSHIQPDDERFQHILMTWNFAETQEDVLDASTRFISSQSEFMFVRIFARGIWYRIRGRKDDLVRHVDKNMVPLNGSANRVDTNSEVSILEQWFGLDSQLKAQKEKPTISKKNAVKTKPKQQHTLFSDTKKPSVKKKPKLPTKSP